MKTTKVILSFIVTGILLFLIFHFIDLNAFIASIKNIKVNYIIVAILLIIATYFVRAKRFELIMHKKGLVTYFSISTVHFFLNKILPARTGELSLPILFHRYLNVSYKKGTSALALFRFLDLFSVILLLTISLLFVRVEKLNQLIVVAFALSIIFLQVLFWFKLNFFIGLLENIVAKIKIKKVKKYKEKLFAYFQQIKQYKASSSHQFFIKLILISIINWLLTYFTFYFIVLAFSINFSVMQIIFATTLANFSMLIPISVIGGFGTFEAGWSAGFVLLGLPLNTALSIGFFTDIFGLIASAVLAAFGYLFLVITYGKSTLKANTIK